MKASGRKGQFYLSLYGDWERCEKGLNMLSTKLTFFIKMFLRTEGEYLKQKMRGMIDSGRKEWKPLSKWTKAIRRFKGIGHNRPLEETGELKNTIEAKEGMIGMTGHGFTMAIGILTNKRPSFSSGKRRHIESGA